MTRKIIYKEVIQHSKPVPLCSLVIWGAVVYNVAKLNRKVDSI